MSLLIERSSIEGKRHGAVSGVRPAGPNEGAMIDSDQFVQINGQWFRRDTQDQVHASVLIGEKNAQKLLELNFIGINSGGALIEKTVDASGGRVEKVLDDFHIRAYLDRAENGFTSEETEAFAGEGFEMMPCGEGHTWPTGRRRYPHTDQHFYNRLTLAEILRIVARHTGTAPLMPIGDHADLAGVRKTRKEKMAEAATIRKALELCESKLGELKTKLSDARQVEIERQADARLSGKPAAKASGPTPATIENDLNTERSIARELARRLAVVISAIERLRLPELSATHDGHIEAIQAARRKADKLENDARELREGISKRMGEIHQLNRSIETAKLQDARAARVIAFRISPECREPFPMADQILSADLLGLPRIDIQDAVEKYGGSRLVERDSDGSLVLKPVHVDIHAIAIVFSVISGEVLAAGSFAGSHGAAGVTITDLPGWAESVIESHERSLGRPVDPQGIKAYVQAAMNQPSLSSSAGED